MRMEASEPLKPFQRNFLRFSIRGQDWADTRNGLARPLEDARSFTVNDIVNVNSERF